VTGAPHSLQNLEFGGSCVPHDPHGSPAAVSPPPPSPLGSTSVSFHRCSVMSGISPCHLRHEVLSTKAAITGKTLPAFEVTDASVRDAFFCSLTPDAEVSRYKERLQTEISARAFLDMVLLSLPKPHLIETPC
jgi:hypothetical protein